MSLTADAIVDRRRTRRRLAVWRAVAFVLAAIALLAVASAFGLLDRLGLDRPHIARVTVAGVITDDRDTTEMIAALAEDEAVKAIIVSIDSPGGTTSGGEALYEALRAAAARKPTVASVGGLAASAGYMAAIATDHIVARRTAITGSIGVLFQYPNVVPLLDKVGVSVNTVKSAPLKAEPSPFSREEVPGARDVIARLVDDTYQWFVDIVAERRKLPREEALRLADGAVYSGRQALALKLVDAVGEEDAAVDWLETTRGVEKDLPVIDRRPASGSPFDLTSSILGAAAGILGFDLRNAADQAMLDGLVSVWHPPIAD